MYPGIIKSVDVDGAIVNFMERTKAFYKWPIKEDTMFYKWSDILMKINKTKQLMKDQLMFQTLKKKTKMYQTHVPANNSKHQLTARGRLGYVENQIFTSKSRRL